MENIIKYNILWFVSFVIFTISCADEKVKIKFTNNSFTIDSTQVKIISTAKNFHDIFVKDKTIKLEVNEKCQIGRISEIIEIKSHNRILITDTKNSEIFLFTLDGKFIKQVGRRGKGPGEFEKLESVYFYDEKIYIASLYKLLVFDIEGNYMKYYDLLKNEDPIYLHKICIVDNFLFVYQRYPSSYNASIIVYSLKDEKVLSDYLPGLSNYGYKVSLFSMLDASNFLVCSSFGREIKQINTMHNSYGTFTTLDNVASLPDELVNIEDQNEQVIWKLQNRKKMLGVDPFYEMIKIHNFVFLSKFIVDKGNEYTIYDLNGSFVNRLNDFKFKEAFLDDSFRDDSNYILYANGLAIIGYKKNSPIGSNPMLILYKLKK